jgi:hypothetical protein
MTSHGLTHARWIRSVQPTKIACLLEFFIFHCNNRVGVLGVLLHFVLTNAPSTFMRPINKVLRLLLDVLIFLYVANLQSIIWIIYVLFSMHYAMHRLFGNLEKCTFYTDRVAFFGYVWARSRAYISVPNA